MTQQQIQQAFQSELGRAPTGAELEYFTQMGQGYGGVGQMSQYETQQALQATPEAQLSNLNKYSGMYQQQLGQSDSYMMGQAGNQLQSQFRKLGRGSSTAYIAAFTQAAQNLAMNRQQQVAQFYGQGLGNVMNNQVSQGNNTLDRSYQLQENQRQFSRDQDLANRNYDRQMDFYNTQRRQGFQSGLLNMGIQAGMGALQGATMGAFAR